MPTWPWRVTAAAVLAIAAVLVVKSVGVASPARFVVDSPVDAVDARAGDGVCRTVAGACTLRAAIQEANALPGTDEIELPSGTSALGIAPRNQNDITTGDLDITDSLTITGAGAGSTTVDGGNPASGAPPDVHGLDRLFEVSVDGGTVAFTGLSITDGYAEEYGGAIANNSTATVTVDGSTMTGNVAEKAGGAIDNHVGGTVEVRNSTLSRNFAYETGGAVNNNRGGTMTLANSTVSANSAATVSLDETLVGAGAIANNAELDTAGTITVVDSLISENRSGLGRPGAISNDGTGAIVVARTVFTKNHASGKGGAIFNGSGSVTIADSTFTENFGTDGGAVYSSADKGGFVTVRDSTFTQNTTTGNGGAILGSGSGALEVFDCTFLKNSAEDWGGAVVNQNQGSVTIENSSFTENSGLNGGGFANEGSGPVTVESSTFTKNTAFISAVLASGEGGGMHSNSGGEVVVSGGTFTDNSAMTGGGLSNEGGGTLTVTGTRFTANHATDSGGGLSIQAGAVRMVNIDVVDNVSDALEEGGGGISYGGDKVVGAGETAALEQSRISGNKAKGSGGGVDSRGDGPLAITTTSITGNTAATGGAVHHVGDAPLDIRRSTLSGNFAEGAGGVFIDGDGEATVENTTVSGNRVGGFGGGFLVSSRLEIRNSTVASNTASSGGGINNGGGDLVGDGFVFLRNTIVANSPTGGNCAGTMTSLGGNLDSANTCHLTELSDQPGTDPRLGPLASNGGPTQTHALLAGSPAQEQAVCTELDPCPSVDQRGVERPRFDGFDAGSYESELTPGDGGDQRCAGLTERPVLSDYDSWISQSGSSSNFGNDSILDVQSESGGNERALVHFDLPPVPPGCKLVSATLRLYASSMTDGRTLQAVRIGSNWDELGVTWGNQPATAGPAATTQSGLETREWDVRDQVLDMYAHGEHGFLIRDSMENATGEQSFHSGEKGPEHPPVLILVFDDPNPTPRPGTCPTTPQSVSSDHDSWVSESAPASNFGTDSTLKVNSQVSANARALIRFNLPILPAGCTSIASARLRVEAASAKDGRTLEARQIAAAWSETGLTWVNQPGTVGPAASIPSASGPLEWDVTEQLLGMYTTGNHGFQIRDAQEDGVGDEQTLNSRHKLTDDPPQLVLTFDDSTPETTIDAGPDAVTEETAATFEFSSDRADARFECSLDEATFRACASPYPIDALAEGDHSLEVKATRRVRAVDPTPARYDWKVAIPPKTTIIDGPASPSDSPDAAVTFTADDPDATFECSLNGADFDPCTSPAEYTNLADGRNEVRVRATDPPGNVEPNPPAHEWTVAVPPAPTIDSGPARLGNSSSASFEFTGTDNGPAPAPLAFECRLDAGAWEPCSSPQGYGVEPGAEPLGDGEHVFELRANDAAGNEGEASYAWTVDTVAPETTIDSGPDRLTMETAASFEFSGTDVGPAEPPLRFECRLDDGEWEACESPRAYGGLGADALPDGDHVFRVRATDGAGNVGAEESYGWTVDTVAPVATVDGGPDALTRSAEASFEFSGTDAGPAEPRLRFECRLDEGDWVACESPHRYGGEGHAALPDGGHVFEVRPADGAGNVGEPASYAWTVDTVAPETTIDSGPDRLTMETAASFEFSGTDVGPAEPPLRFECRLDEGDWVACTSPQAYGGGPGEPPLPDGDHVFRVRAADGAGNVGAEGSYGWTVDTVAPKATIESGPDRLTNRPEARFDFAADEEATFECRLDGPAWEPCESPQEYGAGPGEPPLSDGGHTFEVRATDGAGNLGEAASYSWTVDTVAPVASIGSGPDRLTNHTAASFDFAADEEATFECKLDAQNWVACESPQEHGAAPGEPPLGDGEHVFLVRATDGAGNVGSEESYRWTVDTAAPVTSIGSGPDRLTKSTQASFEFSATEAGPAEPPLRFECRLDQRDWVACSSPQSYGAGPGEPPLADGDHVFLVRATDGAGNVGEAASREWTVDTLAPVARVDRGPAALTRSTEATFEFSTGEAADFECKLDSSDWAACTSPRSYGGAGQTTLADGEHIFQVRATDRAGNQGGAAVHSWTIDTAPPVTTITGRPSDPSTDRAPSFEFSANEEADFECKLDTGDWTACTSGQRYTGLADGQHTFAVRATDRAGNLGAAASYTWTISPPPDGTAPDTAITDAPPNPSTSASASFAFTGSDNETPASGLSFQCRLDSQAPAAFADCASPRNYTGLSQGSHTFEVRAIDAAGNADPTPAGYTWTVDTVAPIVTITSGQTGLTNDSTPTFGFSSEAGATFQCRFDAAAFAPCTSPHTPTPALSDGAHTFQVRATDAAGNTGPAASRSITVDTTAPQTTITEAPPATTTSTSALFRFGSETGVTFECALDTPAFASCSSPQSYNGLAVGSHQFSVRARDAAGNLDTSAATHAWTITAPQQGCGTPITAPAAADAWIDENSPTSNKGTDSILKVQSKGPRDNFRALVRFTLPAVPQGCAVESATLRLYAASAKTPRTLQALRLASAWSENLVNWSNQPQASGAAATAAAGPGYREWTVTSQVQAMYSDGNHGFLIRDAVEGQDAEQQFHSREKGQNPPQLVIRFAATGG
jgi:CSLREA domain-containing protein